MPYPTRAEWLGKYDIYIYIYTGQVGRVFTNGLADRGLIPGRVISKTLKMVLDTALLNTHHYKVRIKGKVEQSSQHLGVVAIEKEPSGRPRIRSPSLLIYIYIYEYVYIYIYYSIVIYIYFFFKSASEDSGYGLFFWRKMMAPLTEGFNTYKRSKQKKYMKIIV